jgi:hypothetical protein
VGRARRRRIGAHVKAHDTDEKERENEDRYHSDDPEQKKMESCDVLHHRRLFSDLATTIADESKTLRFARAATASCHGMTPPVWRVLSRGAMSLAGLAAIREFPVPPNHKSGTAAMH